MRTAGQVDLAQHLAAIEIDYRDRLGRRKVANQRPFIAIGELERTRIGHRLLTLATRQHDLSLGLKRGRVPNGDRVGAFTAGQSRIESLGGIDFMLGGCIEHVAELCGTNEALERLRGRCRVDYGNTSVDNRVKIKVMDQHPALRPGGRQSGNTGDRLFGQRRRCCIGRHARHSQHKCECECARPHMSLPRCKLVHFQRALNVRPLDKLCQVS